MLKINEKYKKSFSKDPRMNRYRIKEVGQTISGKKSTDDTITLKASKFQIGDFMDIAIKVFWM